VIGLSVRKGGPLSIGLSTFKIKLYVNPIDDVRATSMETFEKVIVREDSETHRVLTVG
jgi:hypothetical protein